MIEFHHVVSAAECRSSYLNLSDETGRAYGDSLPGEHKTRYMAIDGNGRTCRAHRVGRNVLWGSVRRWFVNNEVTPGTLVLVRYQPGETMEGMPLIHLIVEKAGEEGEGNNPSISSVRTGDYEHPRTSKAAPRLARAIARAASAADGAGYSPLEQFLLAVIAHELGLYDKALALLERALAASLEVEYESRARKLREVCIAKIEAEQEARRREVAERIVQLVKEAAIALGKDPAELLNDILRQQSRG